MNDVPVKSLKKALDILTILLFEDIAGKGIELSQLARKINIPVNTAHNLLKTMAACGYVAQNEKAQYLAGPRCRQIGVVNHLKDDYVAQLLYVQLNKLSAELQEAVVYVVLAGGRRVSVAQSEPEGQVIKIDRSAVDTKTIYLMPTGMVLAAYASDSELKDIVDFYGSPEREWPTFEQDRLEIRKRRYVIKNPDTFGVVSFGVPVTDSHDRLLGALGCYAPEFRITPEKSKKIVFGLQSTANTLGMILR